MKEENKRQENYTLIDFINKINKLQTDNKLNINDMNMYHKDLENFEKYCLTIIERLKELNYYYDNLYFSKDENFEVFAEKFIKLKQENMRLKEELEQQTKRNLESYFKGKNEGQEEMMEKLKKGLGL